MLSRYVRWRGAMLRPLAGLFLAAGLMLSLAGRYEAQLIHAERIDQEVIGR